MATSTLILDTFVNRLKQNALKGIPTILFHFVAFFLYVLAIRPHFCPVKIEPFEDTLPRGYI